MHSRRDSDEGNGAADRVRDALDVDNEKSEENTNGKLVTSLVAAGLGLAFLSWRYGPGARRARMQHAFESGGSNLSGHATTDSQSTLVKRDTLVKQLRSLFADWRSPLYKVVIGEAGTGKSVAVRQALLLDRFGKGGAKGTLYFLAPTSLNGFPRAFASVSGYAGTYVNILGSLLALFNMAEKPNGAQFPAKYMDAWEAFEPALNEAAAAFERKHHIRPTLVIDAADIIAKQDPAFFRVLQGVAKAGGDKTRKFNLAFVLNEGAALSLLEDNGIKSRMSRPFEVGDISDAEAAVFLVGRYGVAREVADTIVASYTGGRFALLNSVGDDMKRGISFEEICKVAHKALDKNLTDLGIDVDHELFKLLVKDKRYDTNEARKLKGMSANILDQLVKHNILALHPNETYTFQSRYVETFFARSISPPSPPSPAS